MKKPLAIILPTLLIALLWAGIYTTSQAFNDVVSMEPARLIHQCALPESLEPQIESALHDTDLGTVHVQLKAKPSEFKLHDMFIQQNWRYNKADNSYCNSSLKVLVNEEDCTLFIK